MPSEHTLYFDSDGYKLVGTLHIPDTPRPRVIIGCHGLLANRNSVKQISLARACNRFGFAYFRFDHRGCGESEGQFIAVTSLAARVRDLYHAITVLQDHSQFGPLSALFGSSFGGTVVMSYAADHPSPAVVTYAAPINSRSINHTNIRDNEGQAPSSALLTDALEFDISPKLGCLNHILVAHSQGDETVPVSHAQETHRLSGEPKKLLIFPKGDHRMSNVSHQHQFETAVIDWVTAYAR